MVESERMMELKVFVSPELHALVVARAAADERSISSWLRREVVERLAETR